MHSRPLRITRMAVPAIALAAALAAALATGPGRADVVHLKNGNRVEGEISPGSQPGKIRVTIDRGVSFEFTQEEIERIEPGSPPSRQFDERLRALEEDDLDGLIQLAAWARERKLGSRAEEAYRRALRIDPNCTAARRGLGYTVHRNRWVLESELRAKGGLVLHDGEWITPDERDRRALERLRKEVADDFRGVDADNRYIQEFSVNRLKGRRDPRLREIYLEYLDVPSQAVRGVAVALLGRLHSGAAAPGKPSESDPAAEAEIDRRIAAAFHRRLLEEEGAVVRSALADAVMELRQRRFFDLVLETARSSTNALHRDRAADGIVFVLRKEWVPEVIDALAHAPPGVPLEGNPSIRRILERMFGQDFGYRTADWRGWWEKNAGRYSTEESAPGR